MLLPQEAAHINCIQYQYFFYRNVQLYFLNIKLHLPLDSQSPRLSKSLCSRTPSNRLSTALTFVSSVNFNKLLDIALSKSLMNIRKRTEPKTDPWEHHSTPFSSSKMYHPDTLSTICLTTMTLSNFPLNHLYRVPSALRGVVKTATNSNGDKPKRRKPKRRQNGKAKTATHLYGDNENGDSFYRATRMHSADYAVARCLSVRSCVRHTPVLCVNG